jgi:hypothetical protein
MIATIRGFLRAQPDRRAMALEAVPLLARANRMVASRPFPETISFGLVPLGIPVGVDVTALSQTVSAVARRMPFRALCFEQGLTVQRMLRRRGVPAQLHYGIAAADGLKAHVWISVAGTIVHGGELAPAYGEVAQWG